MGTGANGAWALGAQPRHVWGGVGAHNAPAAESKQERWMARARIPRMCCMWCSPIYMGWRPLLHVLVSSRVHRLVVSVCTLCSAVSLVSAPTSSYASVVGRLIFCRRVVCLAMQRFSICL